VDCLNRIWQKKFGKGKRFLKKEKILPPFERLFENGGGFDQ